jgi:acyl dehydratase
MMSIMESQPDVTDGLPLGEIFQSYGRTIGEGEFSLLVDLTWMTNQEHSDREYAKRIGLHDRTLPGPLLIAIAAGLSGSSGFRQLLMQHNVRSIAMMTLEKVRFLEPVYPGDTIRVTTMVTAAKPTSRLGRGLMWVLDQVYNQQEKLVCEYERVILFERTT